MATSISSSPNISARARERKATGSPAFGRRGIWLRGESFYKMSSGPGREEGHPTGEKAQRKTPVVGRGGEVVGLTRAFEPDQTICFWQDNEAVATYALTPIMNDDILHVTVIEFGMNA